MKLNIQLFASSKTITKTIKDSYNNSYTVTATINESLPEDYISTNKTYVSGTVTVSNTGDGGAYTSSKSMSATLSFLSENSSGTTLASATGSCKFDFRGSSTVTATPLTYNNLEISHNNDGSRTIYIQLVLKITETSLKQTQTYTDTLELTTIPRASSIVMSSGDLYLNSAKTLTISRGSISFTHKLYYSFGNLENQTDGLSPYNNVATSSTFTPPLSLATQIPNAPFGICTVTCVTYKDSNQTDENIIGIKTTSFYLYVPSNIKPSVSIGTLTEADSTMSSLNWGIFVLGKSKLSIPITITPQYSSPVDLTMTVNNSTYRDIYEGTSTKTFTTDYLSTTGENSINATGKDKRGKSNGASKTYNVVSYSLPEITEFDVFRCNSGGTANDEGTYIRYKFSASIDAVYDGTNNHNAHLFVLKFRVKGSTGSYTTITTQSGTLSNNKYTATVPYTTYGSSTTTATNYFSPNSAYEFVLEVTDSFRTSNDPVKQTKYIETGFDILNFNSNGKAMAIGKVSEAESNEKLLEVALPTKHTDIINVEKSTGDAYLKIKKTDTNASVSLLVSGSTRGIYDHTSNKWLLYNDGTTVTFNGSASKLGTSSVGGSNRPIYLSSGTATVCNTPQSGNYFGGVPLIDSTGVMEMGKYIDFHNSNSSTNDYDTRLKCDGTSQNTITLPTDSGTIALTNQLPEVTTGTVTFTKTSGNGNITSANYVRYGKFVDLVILFNTSGGSTSAGSNIWQGTLDATDFFPKASEVKGVGYYGSTHYIGNLNDEGTLTIRALGGTVASNNSNHGLHINYISV